MSFRFPFLKQAAPVRRVPEGWRTYAIGDVHGCLEQLDRLLEAIDADLLGRTAKAHLVFLGDVIDRGPQSAGVVDRLLHGPLPGDQQTFLLGNHEEIMLDCIDGNVEALSLWLQFGGIQTLESYGLSSARIFDRLGSLSEAMREFIPADHIAFIRSFSDYLKLEDYLFVHAGIRPDIALDQQSPNDLRWIRSEFLDSVVDHGTVVVHGHSIVTEVEIRHNRIGVDTGCYRTGRLSALVLEGMSKGKLVAQ